MDNVPLSNNFYMVDTNKNIIKFERIDMKETMTKT